MFYYMYVLKMQKKYNFYNCCILYLFSLYCELMCCIIFLVCVLGTYCIVSSLTVLKIVILYVY